MKQQKQSQNYKEPKLKTPMFDLVFYNIFSKRYDAADHNGKMNKSLIKQKDFFIEKLLK